MNDETTTENSARDATPLALEAKRRRTFAIISHPDAGSYGQCCACHEELEIERLEADPAAVFCADCTEERGLH